MSPMHLIWIVPLCVGLGLWLAALMTANHM